MPRGIWQPMISLRLYYTKVLMLDLLIAEIWKTFPSKGSKEKRKRFLYCIVLYSCSHKLGDIVVWYVVLFFHIRKRNKDSTKSALLLLFGPVGNVIYKVQFCHCIHIQVLILSLPFSFFNWDNLIENCKCLVYILGYLKYLQTLM